MAAMKELLARTMDRLEAEGVPAEELEERAIAVLEAEMADEDAEPVEVVVRTLRGMGHEERNMIDNQTVTEFARKMALHDLALALSQGEDTEGLAWGPEHTTALAVFDGSTVSVLPEEIGEERWSELIGAAQDAYTQWMRRRGAELRELRAERLADGWTVVDASGQRWWPTEEAQAQIWAAQDPAYVALRGCISGELRGEWRS